MVIVPSAFVIVFSLAHDWRGLPLKRALAYDLSPYESPRAHFFNKPTVGGDRRLEYPERALRVGGYDREAFVPLAGRCRGEPAKPRIFPNFCQIPPRPTDVRKAGAFKQAVVAIRLSGVHLVAQTAPGTFSLEDTDGFASDARALATPPAPMTPLDGQQTPAFTDQARALARPPGPR